MISKSLININFFYFRRKTGGFESDFSQTQPLIDSSFNRLQPLKRPATVGESALQESTGDMSTFPSANLKYELFKYAKKNV